MKNETIQTELNLIKLNPNLSVFMISSQEMDQAYSTAPWACTRLVNRLQWTMWSPRSRTA